MPFELSKIYASNIDAPAKINTRTESNASHSYPLSWLEGAIYVLNKNCFEF